MDRKTKGNRAEELAKKHYKISGGEILELNYRHGRSEIDLIVLLHEELLVFVEVKMRSREDYGHAETFVSEAQKGRIKEAAEEYIFGINWKGDVRFDIVCVDRGDIVTVFEDAF